MSNLRRATYWALLLVGSMALVVQRFFLFSVPAWIDVLVVGLGAACILCASRLERAKC